MVHRFRLITKSSSSDKLAILVGALKVAKCTSDALSFTPLLGIVAGTILGIVEALQVSALQHKGLMTHSAHT